jgi:hypothetical protein
MYLRTRNYTEGEGSLTSKVTGESVLLGIKMDISWSCLAVPQIVLGTLMSFPVILTCGTGILRVWGSVEVLFYFYLRYVVLPELNKLTTPVQTTPSAYEQFHRTIDVIDEIKVNVTAAVAYYIHMRIDQTARQGGLEIYINSLIT